MRSDRGVRPCERSREAGEGLWPDGSRSICPQDYNPSVCAVAQPAPFTQGGLLCSRRGGFHIRPRRFAAAQDCTRRRGRRPLRPTTKPPLCKGGLLGSRRGEQCSPVQFGGSARSRAISILAPKVILPLKSLVQNPQLSFSLCRKDFCKKFCILSANVVQSF